MDKREKVIKGLESIVNDDWMWKKADYYAAICKDALALLKAQEPVKPTWKDGIPYCGKCGLVRLEWIIVRDSYCRNCGRKVKWDG